MVRSVFCTTHKIALGIFYEGLKQKFVSKQINISGVKDPEKKITDMVTVGRAVKAPFHQSAGAITPAE